MAGSRRISKLEESSDVDDPVESDTELCKSYNVNGTRRLPRRRKKGLANVNRCSPGSSEGFSEPSENDSSREESDEHYKPVKKPRKVGPLVNRRPKVQKSNNVIKMVNVVDKTMGAANKTAGVMNKIIQLPSARPDIASCFFSNDLSNVCRTRCEICPLELNYDMIEFHLSSTHNLSATQYKRTHNIKITKEVFHKCCICGSKLQLTKAFLKSHLSTRHKMDIKSYEKELERTGKRKANPELIEPPAKRLKRSSDLTPQKITEVTFSENTLKSKDEHFTPKLKVPEIASFQADTNVIEPVRNIEGKIKTENGILSKSNASNGMRKGKNKSFLDSNCTKRYSDIAGDYASYLCHESPNLEESEVVITDGISFPFSHSQHKNSLGDISISEVNNHSKYSSNQDIDTPVRYSDTKNDFSTYKCHECIFVGGYRSLLTHINAYHGKSTNKYKELYGKYQFQEKVLHNCKICGEEVIFNIDSLTTHMRKSHTNECIMIKSYMEKYLKPPKRRKTISTQSSSKDQKSSIFKIKIKGKNKNKESQSKVLKRTECLNVKQESCNEEEIKQDYAEKLSLSPECIFNEDPKNCEADHTESLECPQLRERKSFLESNCTKRYSDIASDYSSYLCHECNFVGEYRVFLKHISTEHKKTSTQYKKLHGDYQFHDCVLHNCKICEKEILFTHDMFIGHLRVNHSLLTPSAYIEKYLVVSGKMKEVSSKKASNKNVEAELEHKKVGKVVEDFVDGNLETETLPEEDILAIDDNYVEKGKLKKDYQSVDKDEYLEEEPAPPNEDAFANKAFVNEAENVKDEPTSDSEEFDMNNPGEVLEKDSKESDFINPNEYLLMDNERYSDVLDDYCSYQCAECDYSGRYTNLGRHIINTHKMDKNEYKAKHGEFKFKDKVLHRCKICGDTILYNYDNVLGHVRTKHKETMLFYKNNYLAVRYSDIPYDYSIFNCHECDFSGSDILDHIKKIHNLTIEEYWCKHGDFMFEEKILHECKICGEEFIYSVHGLSEHCSQQYHVHQEKYIADFLNHTLDKEDSQGDGVRNNTIKYIKSKKCYSKKCDKSTHMFFNTETGVRNHNEKFECEEKSTIKTEMGNKKETILTSQLSADKESPSNKVKKGAETVEVPWYNGNTYCCRQCSFDSHCLQSTEDHVRNQHALQSLKKVRKGYTCMGNTHVCRFCEQEVPHEKMAIQDHLEDHCLSLEDYERLYINNTSLLLKKEHVKPTHEDSVSEDTSPSQETLKCATHFLAEEDSPPGGSKREKKYLEQAKLTAHRSNHRREKEYKCEGCDESYRKKRLAKHCKKSHLGQFLYKCTSLEYRTDNKDHLSRHVDSHFKVTDMSCRVQEPEPEIKDDHIYICPLCQYQTKIQGLKDGTGSTHLLEKHQLTFKHFKKSGHRWRKVTLEDAISVLHNILS